MPDYTQENRLISITTPLGEDKLLLAGFSGHEAISRLFNFNLDLLSQGASPIECASIVGQNVTITVTQGDVTPRYFNGVVSRFAQSGRDSTFFRYQMEVVPWPWKLTRVADCKIFHKKTVREIIEKVFSDRGCTDYRFSLTGSYDPLEYTVQYRETDFNFISRLMEQYGIFYFFEHEETQHTMVIADSSSAHVDCPNQKTANYNLVAGGLNEEDVITAWSTEMLWKSGKCTLTDYNFETPASNLVKFENTVNSVNGNTAFEVFDYPGDYINVTGGSAAAKTRMQEVEADLEVAHSTSVCRAFTTGYKFALAEHPQQALNAEYVLTEIQHAASVAGGYSSGGGNGDGGSYTNHFTCIAASTPFRPARITPKPFVQGPQPAVVVGKSQSQASGDGGGGSGEEIWVDNYGRVIVLFPWDRAKACSCWVRVSQEWAGKGWGSMAIPRVGQEVLVSFLEGDPDRPIITGRVYNADQTVPYALPDMQTRSTFMTRSSEGGSASTYNELRFEDKKGKEQVFLRAQFDQDNRVLNDSREWIGKNRSLIVTKDQMEEVDGDRHAQVKGKANEAITGDTSNEFKGNLNQKVGQTLSLNVGENLYEKSGQNFSHQAGVNIDLKGGVNVTIEAGVTLTLKAGSNFVMIGPSGVTILGTLVMINSGGSASSASCGSPTAPTAPTAPDQADDGSTGTKFGGGSSSSSASSPASAAAAPASPPPAAGAPPAGPANAVAAAASQAEQTVQQGTQQAAQAAQQAATTAKQAASQAQQAAQQAEQQAQQAVNQVTQEAKQAFNQAQQALQQAQQAVSQAAAQGQAAAQQALNQVQQQAQQAAQAAKQAVQQAQQEAQQVQQQAQQAAAQAQQAAQQAAAQAQQAAAHAQQQAQQAAAQAQQQAQQAVQQGQQAAQQAQQQAQQAAQQAQQQAQQAAQQAQQQAQQAAAQAQQAAQQAQQQAQQAAQQVQQAAAQAQQQAQQSAAAAQQSASQAISQAQRGF